MRRLFALGGFPEREVFVVLLLNAGFVAQTEAELLEHCLLYTSDAADE